MPQDNLIDQAGDAALHAVHEHGLCGRPDSPPEWNKALDGASSGDPILVKDPDDSRDDFFLVPLIPKNPASKHGAWVMLDTKTLALREASLLENWKALAFPDENSGDAEKASQQSHTLPDGTVARFRKEDFTPNKNNLVWKASAASILPYWPLKELTAPHPITGEPVSIYVTQDGKVYSQLLPDELASPQQPVSTQQTPLVNPYRQPSPATRPSNPLTKVLAVSSIGLLASTIFFAVKRDNNLEASEGEKKHLQDQVQKLSDNSHIKDNKIDKLEEELDQTRSSIKDINDFKSDLLSSNKKQQNIINQRDRDIVRLKETIRSLGDNSNKRIQEQAKSIKDLQARVVELNKINQDLARSLDQTKKEKNDLTQQITRHGKTIKTLREQLASVKKERDRSSSRYRDIFAKHQELLKRIRKPRDEKPQNAVTLNNLIKERDRLQKDLERFSAQVHHAENKAIRGRAQRNVDITKAKLSSIKLRIKQLQNAKP